MLTKYCPLSNIEVQTNVEQPQVSWKPKRMKVQISRPSKAFITLEAEEIKTQIQQYLQFVNIALFEKRRKDIRFWQSTLPS